MIVRKRVKCMMFEERMYIWEVPTKLNVTKLPAALGDGQNDEIVVLSRADLLPCVVAESARSQVAWDRRLRQSIFRCSYS